MTLGAIEPGHGRRRPRQHRQPPPVGRAARHRARRRGDASAPPSARSPSSRPATRCSRARPRPVPAWRALRVVAERRRARADRTRSRRRSSAATTSSGCSRTCSTRPARERRLRLVSVTGQRASARAAWPGSSTSTSTASSRRSTGTRAARRRTARHHVLGARRDGPRAPACSRPTTRRRRARAIAATLAEYVPDEARAALDRAARCCAARPRRGHGGGRDELFAAWRTFFERIAEQGTGRPRVRGPPVGRHRPARLHRPPARVSRRSPDPRPHPRPPELLERRPDWGAGRRNFVVARPSSRCPRRRCASCSTGSCRACPMRPSDAILARADGHPALRRRDGPDARSPTASSSAVDGVYRPVGDLDPTSTSPRRCTRSIAARLDGLDAADRSLLQDAAVLGQTFSVGALAAVCGHDPRRARAATCARLVRRELVAEEIDPRSPERGQYRFVQALIREVAYATLSRRDRRARHLAAARYFEGLGDDELAGVLAQPLPGRVSGHAGGPRGGGGRGPGATRPARRCRTGVSAPFERSGA